MNARYTLVPLLLTLLLSGSLFAQQFSQQSGLLPGGNIWSSGVTSFDADGDGDLDVFFSNGNGFSSAGTKRAPFLLINNGVSGGNPSFTDEASSRLPSGMTLNAKGAVAFDMENDGDLDLFISVAFGQSQVLLENNGSGVFSDVTSSKFTTANINSWGACAFDKDNDGDSDLAVCDNTGSSLTSSGRMRLYQNNGSGNFTQVTNAALPTNQKSSQQNVTPVDLDNDMDLDLVLDGRSTPQFAYMNDGSGVFTLQTSLVPNGSSSVYETDWADLDGDGDTDGFYISLSGFSEGTAKNNLVPSGTLSFTGSTSTISGTNSHDDNELLYLDYDNDGDLDPIVASLGNNREKLYRNNGNFTFTYTTQFSSQTDSSLDITCGDYDGDGDYDVITAQGESGNFTNRYYQNTGVSDTRGPTIVDSDVTGSVAPLVVRAKVTDATMDDGEQYVDVSVAYTITPLSGAPASGSESMRYSGGSIYRAEIGSSLSGELLGAQVDYTITATDAANNVTTSPLMSHLVCGAENYGAGEQGPNGLRATIGASAPPSGSFDVTLVNGNPNSFCVLVSGDSVGNNVQPWGTIIVGPPNFVRIYALTDGAGSVAIPITVIPALVGTTKYYQYAVRYPQSGGTDHVLASDGMKVVFCP